MAKSKQSGLPPSAGDKVTYRGQDTVYEITHALGNIHAATKEERSVDLALQIDAVLNRQLVRRLVLWNFGPECPMPTLKHDVSNEEDLGKRITVDDTLQQMGLPISKKYAYERYGVEVPDEHEELLTRPAGPATGINTPAGPPDCPQFNSERER
ncbi:DUF935 domain-containing protein [Edaphobacter flagellatus]|uniref:DUF935 domain-containing protein n=1 Tax=Edaphobacter flagellatus TaxID=1933044 RepID=UPI0021B4148A|nr:DUF935 domain-containing protein [Edaphobacter flagellatus]